MIAMTALILFVWNNKYYGEIDVGTSICLLSLDLSLIFAIEKIFF